MQMEQRGVTVGRIMAASWAVVIDPKDAPANIRPGDLMVNLGEEYGGWMSVATLCQWWEQVGRPRLAAQTQGQADVDYLNTVTELAREATR